MMKEDEVFNPLNIKGCSLLTTGPGTIWNKQRQLIVLCTSRQLCGFMRHKVPSQRGHLVATRASAGGKQVVILGEEPERSFALGHSEFRVSFLV